MTRKAANDKKWAKKSRKGPTSKHSSTFITRLFSVEWKSAQMQTMKEQFCGPYMFQRDHAAKYNTSKQAFYLMRHLSGNFGSYLHIHHGLSRHAIFQVFQQSHDFLKLKGSRDNSMHCICNLQSEKLQSELKSEIDHYYEKCF